MEYAVEFVLAVSPKVAGFPGLPAGLGQAAQRATVLEEIVRAGFVVTALPHDPQLAVSQSYLVKRLTYNFTVPLAIEDLLDRAWPEGHRFGALMERLQPRFGQVRLKPQVTLIVNKAALQGLKRQRLIDAQLDLLFELSRCGYTLVGDDGHPMVSRALDVSLTALRV